MTPPDGAYNLRWLNLIIKMEEFNGGKALAMNMNRGMLQDLGNTNPEGTKEIDFR